MQAQFLLLRTQFLKAYTHIAQLLRPLRPSSLFMDTVYGVLAMAGMLLSVVAHGYALRGQDILFPYANLPFDGGMLILILAFASLRREFGSMPDMQMFGQLLPRWAVIVARIAAAYAVIVFLVYLARDHGMSAYISNGAYYVKGPGYPATVVAEDIYRHYEAAHVVLDSAYWIFIYLGAGLYFLFRKRESPCGVQ